VGILERYFLAMRRSVLLAGLIAAGRRGDVVERFQREVVRIPDEVVVQIHQEPFRPALEGIAHTLVYEAILIGDLSLPTELVASVTVPTLVIDGEHSPPIMRGGAEALVEALPNGRRLTLAGQSHDISPEAVAPVVEDFLSTRNFPT
jgi:pimeloyl-ACP methyl ester carboxylesterase